MQFSKYSSIDNSYNGKVISKIESQINPNQPFAILEKIHGTNFGVHLDTTTMEVKFSKRSAFLKEDENFYSYEKVAGELARNVKLLKAELRLPYNAVISVYGELCGGNFFGVAADGSKQVQKGVNYHANTKFMAFDIFIDGLPLYWAKAERMLRNSGFDTVPTIKVASNFQEALEVNETFNTMVPLQYGLIVPEEENLAEGVVIKPMNQEITLGNGSRLILKKKTTKFSENKGKKQLVKEVVLSEVSKDLLEGVSTYITTQRMDNTISKLGELQPKDFGKVVGLVVKDALQDYEKEKLEEVSIKDTVGDDWKKFGKELRRIGTNVLKQNWIEYLED